MPIEVPFGYPDYMRRSVVTDQLLVNDSVAGSSGAQYGVFYVANVPALLINMTNGAHPVRVQFKWCSDRLGLQVIRATQIDVPGGRDMVHTVVPQAPYLTIATIMDGLGEVLNYSLQVSIVPEARYPTTDPKWTNLITRTGIPIAGATTVNEAPLVVRCGEITWQANISGGNFAVTVSQVDLNGTAVPIGQIDNTTPRYSSIRAYWGGGGLLIAMANFDAAAQFYDLFITANPTLCA